ncbi:low affinity iron permease family protein [Bosea vaviloviae]|uniref:low affinity iron permease family protein n=1 Tax=Bosea vaviloviae TaxID=1526658 RepID=UPI0018F72BF9
MSSSHDRVIRQSAKGAALFTRLAHAIALRSGKPATFFIALAIIVVWALSGPIFGFNDTWQLVINTSTTIVTFLMVFVIQSSQNGDSAAMQIKLDELISKLEGARRTARSRGDGSGEAREAAAQF